MRKFLSLLLALVMTMSLVTISAGATDFTDDSDITYNEAIDVISAIKVVDGYGDGSFKPTTALNRGQAAKIITNMILGPTAASALTATAAPFKDVPANHTFAAQIAYCAQQGIINGYSDGTFKPGATLTGYAFLKMLEGALGYDGTIEGFTGGNWTINVAKIANGIGLLDGVAEGFSGTATVDRQTACLFAFNTLKADLVEYDSKITATIAGVDVTIGGSNGAKSVTDETQASNTNNWNIINESRAHDQDSQGATSWNDNFAIVQFGERYFPRLVRNNGQYKWNNRWNGGYTVDDLGRPSSTWTYRGEKIGTYTEDPIKTYEGNVSITTIYNDLEMNTATNNSFNGNGVVFVNGVNYSGLTYDKDVKKITALGDGTVKIQRNSKVKINDLTAGFDMAMLAGLDEIRDDIASSKKGYTLTKDQLDDIDDGIIDGATDKKVGNGTKTEVYRNDATNDVIIAIISVYGGKVTSVNEGTAKRDDYIEIEYGSLDYHAPVGMDDNHNWFETTGLKEDDVVAYTYSNSSNSIQTMEKIDSVEGSLAKRTVGKDLTLGDTTYKYAQEYNFEYGLNEDGLTNKSNYRVFLDEFGYALWIEEAAFNAKEYALIERITSEKNGSRNAVVSHTLDDMTGNYDGNDNQDARVPQLYNSDSSKLDWTTNRVQLLFADGSERTVSLDRSYYTTETTSRNAWTKSTSSLNKLENSSGDNLEFWAGDVVRVSELSSGSVRLNRIGQTSVDDYAKDKNVRNTFLSMIGATTPAAKHDETVGFATIMNRNLKFDGVDVYTDSNTIFVVRVDNGRNSYDWKVYTGIKNAPTVELGVGFAYMRGGVAKIVYITDGDVKNVSRDVTFITGASVSKLRTETDGRKYYTYDAVVRGEVTSIMIDAEIESKVDANGNPMHATVMGKDFVIGKGTDEKDGKVMIINNYISDTDDVITKLEYASNEVSAEWAQGIKKISGSTGEIKVGADGTNYGRTLTLASNVKVFLADNGGGIDAVELDDIKTSKTNYVYWTLDDGLVTNLFVIEVPDRD